MARNRKRRSDRRPPHRPDVEPSRPGVATARAQRDEPLGSSLGAPDPIEHAAPDADLAEAQLAAGRAEPVDEAQPVGAEPLRHSDDLDPEDRDFDDPDLDEEEPLDDGDLGGGDPGGPRRRRRGGGGGDDSGGDLTPRPSARPARRRNRLLAFAQGSWRELQRVQWPDRRQTMQATGVVIGFVIVAGAYLGVADWVATKIVHFILS